MEKNIVYDPPIIISIHNHTISLYPSKKTKNILYLPPFTLNIYIEIIIYLLKKIKHFPTLPINGYKIIVKTEKNVGK